MDKCKKVEAILKSLEVTLGQYKEIMRLLDAEMTRALHKDTFKDPKITLEMFNAFVCSTPGGSENGNFLALDLGGSNFRVLLISVKKNSAPRIESRVFPCSQEIVTGTGEQLFDYIAGCIYQFVEDHGIRNETLPLGFTFSFPTELRSLASAILVNWNKTFSCADVPGKDIVTMLHAAIKKRKGLNVECVAVTNDTTGTLISCSQEHNDCRIGVIVGTGCNACYMEDLHGVTRYHEQLGVSDQISRNTQNGHENGNKPFVVINTEYGGFGDSGCLNFVRTEFDVQLDNESLVPGHHILEKMVGGLYMGEIVRLILVTMAREGLILSGKVTDDLAMRERFYTKFVSEIESDIVNSPKNSQTQCVNTRHVLEQLGYQEVAEDDIKTVQKVCTLVSKRAACLVATGIASFLTRMDRPSTTVGVDGSVYKFNPLFHDRMVEHIGKLTNSRNKFKVVLSTDGSGKGAALLAAAVHRAKQTTA